MATQKNRHQTAARPGSWSDRAGALSALARSEALRRGVRLLSHAVLGALFAVVALVAAATGPTLFGYHTYIVSSGSMGSVLPVGSVAVTKPTSPYELDIGDIIVRREMIDGPPILHRIIEITKIDGQPAFITRGDQNRYPDREPAVLQGPGDKVVYDVPYAGFILNFGRSWPGRLLFIGLPLTLFASVRLRGVVRSPRRQQTPVTRADDSETPSPSDVMPPGGTDERDGNLPVLAPPEHDAGAPSGQQTKPEEQRNDPLVA